MRKPQSADLRNLADFRRVFNDNPEIIDRELKAMNDALSALTGLAGEVGGTGNTVELLPLLTRLYLLESSAFAGLRKEDDGWYAYNKNGQDVGGPYRFGSIDGMTLNEYLSAVTDDSVTYQEPVPITGTELGPNITLNGLLDAVSDDSVTYQNPTPLVDE